MWLLCAVIGNGLRFRGLPSLLLPALGRAPWHKHASTFRFYLLRPTFYVFGLIRTSVTPHYLEGVCICNWYSNLLSSHFQFITHSKGLLNLFPKYSSSWKCYHYTYNPCLWQFSKCVWQEKWHVPFKQLLEVWPPKERDLPSKSGHVYGDAETPAWHSLLGRTVAVWALSKFAFPPEDQRLQATSFCATYLR